jgi:hypothetical protein
VPVPTAPSSTDPRSTGHLSTGHLCTGHLRRLAAEARRSAGDLRHLVAFRAASVRGGGRRGALVGLGVVVLLTVASAVLPAHLGAERWVTAAEVSALLPSAYLGVLVLSTVSASVSGGGRELLPRDQGTAFPVSPTTDHLGALLMAPLNIAWLLQSWTVLAATAHVVGPHRLVAAQVPVLVWLVASTALAQVVAWGIEWVRRGPHGRLLVGGAGLAVTAGVLALAATVGLPDPTGPLPTHGILDTALHGAGARWGSWAAGVVLLALVAAAAVVLGARLAHVLGRRPVREESRLETAVHPARAFPRSDLAAVLRLDRAGVRRSLPMRRGFAVLAVLPGVIAVVSGLDWASVIVLPALVVSGGALLFGVNAWSLDGRGALWRESLPVPPRLTFTARLLVLGEMLLVSAALVIALAAVRAGPPTAVEAVSLAAATVVAILQVLSGSLRWSVRRPFAVDLRSARATPAPPLVMVGYSTRLAVVTTFTALVFVAASQAPSWRWPVLLAVPFLLASALRIGRTARVWDGAEDRSRVVTTVAG